MVLQNGEKKQQRFAASADSLQTKDILTHSPEHGLYLFYDQDHSGIAEIHPKAFPDHETLQPPDGYHH